MAKKKKKESIDDDGFITIDTSKFAFSEGEGGGSTYAYNPYAIGVDIDPDWLGVANPDTATVNSDVTFTIAQNIDYKFNEKEIVKQIQEYVDATYTQHYAKNKFQATEFIFDSGHAEGFCIGNIMKYAQRYGKKDGYNRNDLMKVIHYAIMAVHNHDLNHQ